MMQQTDAQNGTAEDRPVPYSVRLYPKTIKRLEMMALAYDLTVGQLIHQMAALNYKHAAKDGGQFDKFFDELRAEDEE